MDDPKSVEELQRLLQEAQQRADEAERQRQEEKQRADEAERQREEEKQRAEASEEQTRNTTLEEYMAACHNLVFSKFAVETDSKLTSTGSITNPRDKLCPTNLRPWSDFLQQQRTTLGTLYAAFPTESRVFENLNFLAGLGNRISRKKIANEKVLEYFQHNSVEDPVRAIMEQLKEIEEVRRAFGIEHGLIFENHPHAISDVAEEVVGHQTPFTLPRTPDHRRNLHQLRPDQICIYRSEDGPSTRRTMVYISEYKAPHKLTPPHLRVGLHPMNIFKDVVNRKTIPTSEDPEALFQYHAERLTAAAITQTYHYMIEGGLEYSLLTTGETIVFLKVDWREPETLYYHLAEPGPEVLAHPYDFHPCTSVGQYLAFSLMALGLPGQRRGHGQAERQRAINRLKTWSQDFEATLRSIPDNERSAPSGSSAYEPTTYKDVDRSPYLLRHERRRPMGTDEPDGEPSRRDPSESSDDESAPNFPDTPCPTERRSRQTEGTGTRRSQRILALRPGGGGGRGRQYCTQKCLLGLVRGGRLDQQCPNVALHCERGVSVRHPVDHTDWLRLLRKQLEQSLDDGIVRLDVGGSRGVLFQVTLLAYGYTFVSKGTVSAFIGDLQHEGTIYEHLRWIQGVSVPVFLGSIDLRDMDMVYYYDHRVYIVHLTFLSWGGYEMDGSEAMDGAGKSRMDKAMESLMSIHQEGVVHEDVRSANMLFNPETNGVMIIDFERASLVKRPRHPLASSIPRKRRWAAEMTDGRKAPDRSCGQTGHNRRFKQEILMAQGIFST
jgi:hypothetical protein